MPTLIKYVRNRHIVEFDKGLFDHWCVFLTKPGRLRYAPKDNEYFLRLQQLGHIYGNLNLYNDFVTYYLSTNKVINPNILNLITGLSYKYGNDAEEVDIWFSVIYGGMVAEENKANTILKKRVKRLGMHQVLIERLDPAYAANFSKGKKWWELDKLMKERGF